MPNFVYHNFIKRKMKNNIKIAVIGGTGKSGKYLVKELISRGHHFKALVRNSENFTINSPLAKVVIGDVADSEKVEQLLQGCDAVISTLGWGNPPSPNTIFSLATQNILQAMDKLRINRYILVTGLHVDTSADNKSEKTKMATDWMYENYSESTKNRQYEYELLCKSDVDWTLVRLPLIELTDYRRKTEISLKDCLGDKISATDLAHFLVEQIEDKSFVRKAPFIANH